jgi:hypothetical protein
MIEIKPDFIASVTLYSIVFASSEMAPAIRAALRFYLWEGRIIDEAAALKPGRS